MEPEVSAGGKDGKLSAYSITDMWPQGTIHYMIDDRFTATERLAIAAFFLIIYLKILLGHFDI